MDRGLLFRPEQVPVVNLNGTSKRELLDLNITAMTAVDQAMQALAKAVPHGRDYQTVDKSRYEAAREWHTQLMRELRNVHGELEIMTNSIASQR
jgi:folate-dependent phosphoribosylglycinamide formyltransferase PurN